jgi:vacuolar protein sorting-associated protein 8
MLPNSLSPGRRHSFDSDNEGDGHDLDENANYGGDYSTRMEELFDGVEEGSERGPAVATRSDDEESVIYSGAGARTYKERLRDVLGPDEDIDSSDNDHLDELEVETSLTQHVTESEEDAFPGLEVPVSPDTPVPHVHLR